MGLEPVLADALHDAQPLAELGEAANEVVQRAGGDQLVAPSERGDQPLPDFALVAERLDDLEVLTGGAWCTTTLEAHEHGLIMRRTRRETQEESPRRSHHSYHYILARWLPPRRRNARFRCDHHRAVGSELSKMSQRSGE
jgi:hypothetical protein